VTAWLDRVATRRTAGVLFPIDVAALLASVNPLSFPLSVPT
jgi:hypothetical protein